MAKIKSKKHDTFIDMTAMSDVTVLLLTFFMLTANFIPKEPVLVYTPASVSEFKVPDYNVLTILIEPVDGKVFLNIDMPETKRNTLLRMGQKYNVRFSEREVNTFLEPNSFAGVPMRLMNELLSRDAEDQEALVKENGIPQDSANNQLAEWIKSAKEVNPDLRIAVKADQFTPYPSVETVMSTLQEINENRFSLMTSLRGMPADM